ncbi:sulfotransferase [Euzebya rosea]|uniref:sulfotransferase n=1 Tax=Euzebya rosea TaxID=2052804 RepID=UPI000D3EC981|nr:sulfotransferase [Euzebya rosea]
MAGPPIFVTGANRSGTTWMGNVLSLAADVAYVHEPFSPSLDPAVGRIPTRAHFTHATTLEAVQQAALDRLLAGRVPNPAGWRRDVTAWKPFGMAVREVGRAVARRRRRVLIKDPTACLLAPAVHEATGGPVVFMVRRPEAYVSSITRLGWGFDFTVWATDERLMGLLGGVADEVARAAATDLPIFDQAITIYNGIYTMADRFRADHPDWLFLRHEEMAADPLETLPPVYERLGLDWTPEVVRAVERDNVRAPSKDIAPAEFRTVVRQSSATVDTWRARLDDDEADTIRARTHAVASLFYDDV